MLSRDLEDLTPNEQKAFAHLARLVGFAPQVQFGRGNQAKLLRYIPNAHVLYALARTENPYARIHGVWEYRLFVAFPGESGAAEEGELGLGKRKGPKASTNGKAKFDRQNPAFVRKMRRAQQKAWERRRERYGPKGFSPGKEPWKKALAVKAQKREETAPERPLRTF